MTASFHFVFIHSSRGGASSFFMLSSTEKPVVSEKQVSTRFFINVHIDILNSASVSFNQYLDKQTQTLHKFQNASLATTVHTVLKNELKSIKNLTKS